jgi:hypothetical protein
MLPLLAAGAICWAIGSLLEEDKQPETRVITRYVQDTNNYHYTQNNYTYNINVNNHSYKKHFSYHSKAKFVISNNKGQFLTDGGSWVYDCDYAKKFSIGAVKACTRKLRQLGYRCRYDKL